MNADNFTLETFTKIMNMVHKINNKTEIIMYNANKIKDDFKIREDKGISFHIDYARLYAFKEIKDIKKIIMLNLENIMIEKDLSELYDAEMIDIYGRGLPEVPTFRHSEDWIDSYLFDKSHFINGDVILINLELCQKDNFYDKAKELNNDEFYKKTDNPTQDILNILMRKKVEFLNPKYNKISFYENPDDKNDETKWYPWVAETIKYGEKNNHFYTKEDYVSAHYIIRRDGFVKKLVNIEDRAWANGTSTNPDSDIYYRFARSNIINSNSLNANDYTISIEHISFDGSLSDEQFYSSVNTIKEIIREIKEKYNYDFIIDEEHIIGHRDVTPITRPYCPGDKFPMKKIIDELKK